MCRVIHKALSLHFSRRGLSKVVSVPCVNAAGLGAGGEGVSGHRDITGFNLEQVWDSSEGRRHDDHGQQAHRPRLNMAINCNVMALVTRLLNRKDPEYHSAAARAAVDSQVSRLESAPVWARSPIAQARPTSSSPTLLSLACSVS